MPLIVEAVKNAALAPTAKVQPDGTGLYSIKGIKGELRAVWVTIRTSQPDVSWTAVCTTLDSMAPTTSRRYSSRQSTVWRLGLGASYRWKRGSRFFRWVAPT